MTLSIPQFRADYPEFSSTSQFPPSQVQYWLTVAEKMLDAGRWGEMLPVGVALYAAHNLVLEAKAQAAAANGGIGGGDVGPVNSKSVDKVSVGIDTSSGTEDGAGHWNTTIYGTRLYRLIKMFGAGPIQIGIGTPPPFGGPAWPGPGYGGYVP